MKIKSVRRLGNCKDQIVVNEYYIYKLILREERGIKLTARRIGYTSKGIRNEVFKKGRKGK